MAAFVAVSGGTSGVVALVLSGAVFLDGVATKPFEKTHVKQIVGTCLSRTPGLVTIGEAVKLYF